MQFIFEQIKTGGDRNFGYLIGDREAKTAFLIDPSYQPEQLIQRAKDQGLKITHVINTHGHGDHTNGNNTVKEKTKARIATYKNSSVPHDMDLEDEQELKIGIYTLKIFHVPGHADDHIVLYLPDFHIALTGDHLFVGKIGGTSTEEQAKEQYDSLNRILEALPAQTTIWPGHDYGCRPSSTLELEKAVNPFLSAKTFDEFYDMKKNWPKLKAENGLM